MSTGTPQASETSDPFSSSDPFQATFPENKVRILPNNVIIASWFKILGTKFRSKFNIEKFSDMFKKTLTFKKTKRSVVKIALYGKFGIGGRLESLVFYVKEGRRTTDLFLNVSMFAIQAVSTQEKFSARDRNRTCNFLNAILAQTHVQKVTGSIPICSFCSSWTETDCIWNTYLQFLNTRVIFVRRVFWVFFLPSSFFSRRFSVLFVVVFSKFSFSASWGYFTF